MPHQGMKAINMHSTIQACKLISPLKNARILIKEHVLYMKEKLYEMSINSELK